jgi:hypothetical protein
MSLGVAAFLAQNRIGVRPCFRPIASEIEGGGCGLVNTSLPDVGPQTDLTSEVEQFLRCSADLVRSRVNQFLFTAVAIEDAYSSHSIVSRPNHIVASVSNHCGLQWINTCRLEGVIQKLGLTGISAIQSGTKHAFKINIQFEVIDNALGVDIGFAGRNKQAPA